MIRRAFIVLELLTGNVVSKIAPLKMRKFRWCLLERYLPRRPVAYSDSTGVRAGEEAAEKPAAMETHPLPSA